MYEAILEAVTGEYEEFSVDSLKSKMGILAEFNNEGVTGFEKEFKVMYYDTKIAIVMHVTVT